MSVSLDPIRTLVARDMEAVDALIRRRLDSDVVLVRQVAEYIVASGGNRLRPALLLLCAGACGYPGPHHHELAAVVEFIHTGRRRLPAERRGRSAARGALCNEVHRLGRASRLSLRRHHRRLARAGGA